jgi:hypothetical protein
MNRKTALVLVAIFAGVAVVATLRVLWWPL